MSPNVWGAAISLGRTPTNRWNTDISTADTVRILCRYARMYANDSSVRDATQRAISRLFLGTSQRDQACAIFHFIRSTIRFVEDEEIMYRELGVQPADLDKELLIVPPVLLGMPRPMGDCDDFSLLMASMLLACGIRPFYVTVAADRSDPFKFSHIYNAAYLSDEGSYIPLDAGNRMQGVPPGWESTDINRKAIWAI